MSMVKSAVWKTGLVNVHAVSITVQYMKLMNGEISFRKHKCVASGPMSRVLLTQYTYRYTGNPVEMGR